MPRLYLEPLAIHTELADSPWNPDNRLLMVGVQGFEPELDQRPAANLVFLVDVSGSMNSPDKLGLVQFALTTLVNTLRPDDTIGIVVYAGREGIALEPTAVADRGVLLRTIESLSAGGSTNGESGIRAAYDLAQARKSVAGWGRRWAFSRSQFSAMVCSSPLIRLRVSRKHS